MVMDSKSTQANKYIPPSVQQAMNQHMQHMPANLQKYQSGNTYIPAGAQKAMTDYMKKSMPAHMQEYIGSYMKNQVTSGLNSINPGTPRAVQSGPRGVDLMRRDHSAFNEQFNVTVDSSPTAGSPKSLSFSPQYSSSEGTPSTSTSENQSQPQNNPYDFLDDKPPIKKGLFSSGGGGKQKSLIVIVGTLLLITVIAVMLFSVFGGTPSNKTELLGLAQEQNELIRISDIGTMKARGADAKNLAVISKLTFTSDQQPLLAALKTQKVKVTTKQLDAGKDSKTDDLLTQAEQANRFDEVFIQTLQSKLTAYQRDLKKAHDSQATGKKLKLTLSDQYRNASLIINVKPEL